MASNSNSTPRWVFNGIQDGSVRAAPRATAVTPIVMPLLMTLAERGPEIANIASDDFEAVFGAGTTKFGSPFYTHAVELMQLAIRPAPAAATTVRRLIPSDANIARIQFALDIIETELVVYQRDGEGKYIEDENGDPIPVEPAQTVPGVQGKWVVKFVEGDEIGEVAPSTGSMLGSDGTTTSMIYPIFDIEISHFGKYGDNIGFALSAPSGNDAEVDEAKYDYLRSFIYNLNIYERSAGTTKATLQRTLSGGADVAFTLQEGDYYEPTKTAMYAGDSIVQAYRDIETNPAGSYGPIKTWYTYQNNIELILNLIYPDEIMANPDITSKYQVNLLNAFDINGAPHYHYQVLGIEQGGLIFTRDTIEYAIGGSDGTITSTTFDDLVREEFLNMGNSNIPYKSMARYPFRCFIDSGFSMETKLAIPSLLKIRPDAWVGLATQTYGAKPNSVDEDSSVAAALKAELNLYPESKLYGTKALRAFIIGQSGYLLGGGYSGRNQKVVPTIFDLTKMLCSWGGAGNGYLNDTQSPDVWDKNVLSLVVGITNIHKTDATLDKDWSNGCIRIDAANTADNFIPAMCSMYEEKTSVLSSLLNVIIACDVVHTTHVVWIETVGRTLSPGQYEQLLDDTVTRMTKDRYSGRVTIVPAAYHTADDTNSGYSIHSRVEILGKNMKTVEIFEIVANRETA